MIEFNGGAKRSDMKPMYRLIPLVALERLALTLTEGHIKYDPDIYTRNWKKGDQDFAAACYDHLIEHVMKGAGGDTTEDHLGHAMANIAFLMWYEEMGIYNPASKPQPEFETKTEGTELPEVEPEPEPEPGPAVPEKPFSRLRALMGLKNLGE